MVDRYRDFYGNIQRARLYDGIFETLRVLEESDVLMGVATAKRVISLTRCSGRWVSPRSFAQSRVSASTTSLTTKKQVLNGVLDYFSP